MQSDFSQPTIASFSPDYVVVAAISGAGAGAIQAVAGAPAENVRLLMERGAFNTETSVSGWRHAWKAVFVDTSDQSLNRNGVPVRMKLSDAREAKIFVSELREMAGRGMFILNDHYSCSVDHFHISGWNGWGWGLAKDVCGE